MNPELSIIVLCYRSEHRIIPFIEEIKTVAQNLTSSFEIVLVANYIENSNDKTADIVKQIAKTDSVYKTICKPKEGMMGWDMREGLSMAKGDYLCVIDGDGQFPTSTISKCFNTLKEKKCALVKTYRVHRKDGFYRRFISTIYNWIFAFLFSNLKSKDVNSKPKIFTRAAYQKMNLSSDDWFIDAEIMIAVNKHNMSFYEIETAFLELKGRTSFVKFSAIFEFIKNLIRFKIKDLKS